MMGTRIVLDEEKILREGKYKLDELYAYLDNIGKEADLIKKDKFTYICKGDEQDLSCLGIFVANYVSENESITKNLKEWTWLDDDEGNINIIEHYKSKGVGVWQ